VGTGINAHPEFGQRIAAKLSEMSGLPLVQGAFQGWAPQIVGEIVASLSFLNHFHSLARGLVDLRSLIYFGSLIVLALMVNTAVIDLKKGS